MSDLSARPSVIADLTAALAQYDSSIESLQKARAKVQAALTALEGPPGSGPVKAVLTLSGGTPDMPISIDFDNETATVGFVDDHGDAAEAPTGTVATFGSDNESVFTVATDAENPLQGDITPVGIGTANVTCTFNGTALEEDGVTPIPDPAPAPLSVVAGAAVGAALTLAPATD